MSDMRLRWTFAMVTLVSMFKSKGPVNLQLAVLTPNLIQMMIDK